ncbi:putative aminotransferase TAT2 [Sesamum angolense]|uniref:Aminotransferase TAT2 n=1 Tax=Sesamum angolense TaxID=2727404 RepID=A0AAE1WS23_9LAMI|nr:putative aminotransferase TAT2 [Sesamum angolense]
MEVEKNGGQEIEAPKNITIKGILGLLMANTDGNGDAKKVISLGMGDPTAYSCFYTTSAAQEAVVDALRSAKFNGYSPTGSCRIFVPQPPYELAPDDVYVTAGCTQAIEIALSIINRPGANILLPRPGWEVDLSAVENLADHNTVAMVIINPGNPCGSVYTYQHLKEIAETAKRLGTLVIADEVYGHLAFGANPFVPMGVFGSLTPVLTLGSMSKRWLVPGWRLGWLVTNDPDGSLKSPKFVERLKKYCDICGGPATFIQAAVPAVIEGTQEVFFNKTINILKQNSDTCFQKIKEIHCISCPHKAEGSMALMVKLNVSLLKDISDDLDFCFKLAKEESVIILPGVAVGLKNWLRITFAADPCALGEALERVKSFCQRHSC